MSDRRHSGKAKVRPSDALLLPYQKRWVEDASRLKLCEKSRQIGWTWATAYRCVRVKSTKGARLDTWISSRDDLQARLFLQDCKNFADILQTAAQDLGEKAIDDAGHSAYVLAMATGVRLNSMSSNANAQAGKRGDRVLDEFALHPDPRFLYSIAYPGITWGGSMEIFSTHRGSKNFFNDLVREIREKGNPKGFSLHRVTLQDALEDGFLYKLQSKLPADDERQAMDEADYYDFIKSGCADEESFLQEYMCVAADDESAFLPYDLIASCEYREGQAWEMDLAEAVNPLYVGVDIGRKKDLTVIYVIEAVAGMKLTRQIITLQNMPKPDQERVLWPILELPQVKRACIDNTGLGIGWVDDAQRRFGSYRVEGVTFTSRVKEELAYPVKAAFEDRSIRVPYDKALRADLRSIRKTTTAAGNIRFEGETAESHADRFWSLALALHAAGKAGSEMPPKRLDRPTRHRVANTYRRNREVIA